MNSIISWLISAGLGFIALMASGQDLPTGETAADIEEVIVLGSRARSGDQAHELPVPVDVYDEFILDHAGEIDLGAVLTKLSPSFNYSRNSLGDGGLLNPAALRAMSPDQTLVLVNGKRRHGMAWLRVLDGVIGWGTGGTDLRAIPSAAIKRVEVLRDGAAAQYGSDAIAGVINLELKDYDEGGDVTAYGGLSGNANGDRIGVAFNVGAPNGDGGFVNITGEWHDEDSLERNGGNGGDDRRYQDELIIDSSPEYDNMALFLNSEMPLSDTDSVYAFGGYSKREGRSSGAYRFAYRYWDGIETGDDAWDAALPTAINLHERNNHVVYPDGFLPQEESEITDVSLVAGWRGLWREWELDASIGYGSNEFSFGVSNSINASIGAQYLADNPNATVDDIKENSGPTSGGSGGIELDQTTLNFDARRDFVVEQSGVSALGLGAEYRTESYRQIAGTVASWSCGLPHVDDFSAFAVGPDGKPITGTVAACGFQGYPGYSPENARLSEDNRSNLAAYGELNYQFGQSTMLDGALRWENYSDAGASFTTKIAAIRQLSEGVALRGAMSTGFRAPSLSQRRFNSIVFAGSEAGLTTTLVANEGHAVARALGVDELKHETSTHLSAGFIIEHEGFQFSIDLYQIGVKDQIVRSLGIGCAGIAACDEASVSTAAVFFNGLDTRSRGGDIATHWNVPIQRGDLWLSMSWNFNRTKIIEEHLPANAPEALAGEEGPVETDFSAYFGGWAKSLLVNGQPRRQTSITADWDFDGFGVVARANYYGHTEQNPVATGAIRVDSATTADLEFRFGRDRARVVIGINNVFDELPTALPKRHLANVLWGMSYPADTTIGLGGRYIYGRYRYLFGN